MFTKLPIIWNLRKKNFSTSSAETLCQSLRHGLLKDDAEVSFQGFFLRPLTIQKLALAKRSALWSGTIWEAWSLLLYYTPGVEGSFLIHYK